MTNLGRVVRPSMGVGVALSLLLAVLGVSATQGGGPSPAAVDQATAARAAYGLPGERSRVRKLMSSGNHAASERYGFPLTTSEHRELMARNAYAREFEARILPIVRKLDGYAGTWVDHANGGRMVVAMTKVTNKAKRQVRARLADGGQGVRFAKVDDSADDLHRALARADRDWAALKTGLRPQSFGVSYRHNDLVVKVLPRQLAKAERFAARMARRSGVDVRIEATTRLVDMGCPSRQKCHGPLRLGVRINYGAPYKPRQQWNCAIGFMLSNRTILTAGHCTHRHEGPWHGHAEYRSRYGRIGRMVSSRYTSKHRDLSLIKLDDWRANKASRIFGDAWPAKLTQPGNVVDNMDVCVSLARQNKVWCGRVTEPRARWWSSTAGIWVWGAGMRFNASGRTALPGDSGSPIVSMHQACPKCTPKRTPIGIVASGNEADKRARDPRTGKRINADIYFSEVHWALENPNGWPKLKIHTAPNSTPRPDPTPTPRPKPQGPSRPYPKHPPKPTPRPWSDHDAHPTASPQPASAEATSPEASW